MWNNAHISVILAVTMAGCAVRPEEIGRAPALSAIGSAPPLQVAAIPQAPVAHVRRARGDGSAWVDSAATLFRDARAMRVGDVITVKISIKDKAVIDNTSNRSRESAGSIEGTAKYDVGIESVSRKASATGSLDANAKTSSTGKGGVTRSESIDLLIAAVVLEVLPNGNLLIQGAQEVRVNFELRELTVAGIVRPRDVATDNTISYDRIAEARISYGGRGRITEVQQPAWGQQILDAISPY